MKWAKHNGDRKFGWPISLLSFHSTNFSWIRVSSWREFHMANGTNKILTISSNWKLLPTSKSARLIDTRPSWKFQYVKRFFLGSLKWILWAGTRWSFIFYCEWYLAVETIKFSKTYGQNRNSSPNFIEFSGRWNWVSNFHQSLVFRLGQQLASALYYTKKCNVEPWTQKA